VQKCELLVQLGEAHVVADCDAQAAGRAVGHHQSVPGQSLPRLDEPNEWCVEQMNLPVGGDDLSSGVDDDVRVEDALVPLGPLLLKAAAR
jgi:hypothetical protein